MGKHDNAKKPKAPALAAGLNRVQPTKAIPSKQLDVLGPDEDADLLIVRFNRPDEAGPWCIATAGPKDLARIFAAVRQFETMRPLEAFKGYPGKDYPLSSIIKEARERLEILGLDDRDYISRLQLDGVSRLYGIRRGRYFHALWWDPRHEICPSTKRNT